MTTNQDLTIRRATINDADLLARLNRFVHNIHLDARPDNFRATDTRSLTSWFRTLLEQRNATIWIADEGQRAVGYVSVFQHERPENALCKARKWLEIDNIAVDAGCRRRGIGRALIERVLQQASTADIADIELTSWDFNRPAHAFFERCGFRAKTIRFARRTEEPGDGS